MRFLPDEMASSFRFDDNTKDRLIIAERIGVEKLSMSDIEEQVDVERSIN